MGLTAIQTERESSRRLYNTNRPGQSNEGHYFESFKKLTEEDRLDLIEYLKTL